VGCIKSGKPSKVIKTFACLKLPDIRCVNLCRQKGPYDEYFADNCRCRR
jgi:hypothetical protein